MAKRSKQLDPVPERFDSEEEAAEFWDTHSYADIWDSSEEAQFEFRPEVGQHLVAVQPDLMAQIHRLSTAQGIGAQTLINLWLAEKVATAVGGAR